MGSPSSLLVVLVGAALGLAEGACWSWDPGQSNKEWEKVRKGRSAGWTGRCELVCVHGRQPQLPNVFCCRAGDETGVLDLGEH